MHMNLYRSRSGSNQPESLSIELPMSKDKLVKGKRRKKVVDTNAAKNILLQLDSPARGTGRKNFGLVVLHLALEAKEG